MNIKRRFTLDRAEPSFKVIKCGIDMYEQEQLAVKLNHQGRITPVN